jgi:membrane protease YdiL (CAAX protease family)
MGSLSILLTTSAYLSYYFLLQSRAFRTGLSNDKPLVNEYLQFMWRQRLSGVLLLGIIPGIIVSWQHPDLLQSMGMTNPGFIRHWPWYLSGMLLMFLLSSMGARQADTQARYPELPLREWTGRLFMVNALGWLLYLAAYEFLFRGILLFGTFQSFGYWPAVAINIAIYAFAHVWKGWPETLGSVFFGLIASVATLETGSWWLPFAAHAVTSINTEYQCIRLRKDLSFVSA